MIVARTFSSDSKETRANASRGYREVNALNGVSSICFSATLPFSTTAILSLRAVRFRPFQLKNSFSRFVRYDLIIVFSLALPAPWNYKKSLLGSPFLSSSVFRSDSPQTICIQGVQFIDGPCCSSTGERREIIPSTRSIANVHVRNF